MRRVNGGAREWWRWNGFEEYAKYGEGTDGSTTWDIGAIEKTYLPGLAEALPAGGVSMASYRHYTTDHLGSTRRVYSPTRTQLATYAYTPFGEARAQAGLPLEVGYTGHHWDPHVARAAPASILAPRPDVV